MLAVHRNRAELLVDVVNAVRDDDLDEAWVEDYLRREPLPVREHDVGEGTAGLLESLRRLGRDTGPVFAADDAAAAADRLNDLLARLRVQVSVSIGDDWPAHLHFDARGEKLGDRVRVNCLMALAMVLADPADALRLGECAAYDCEHVYADFSRSERQRFCSRRCATRSHVSEHRARLAARP